MSEAALLELVSRGKQDAYFIQDARRTWFGADIARRNGGTREVRLNEPLTPCQFGSRVEIDLPRTGDILESAQIRINLPTWLPPEVAAINRDPKKLIRIATTSIPSGVACYGWTNGIANFLIQKWQLFADNLLLCEGYGEIGSWYPFTQTTQNKAPILQAISGQHDGSQTAIQWAATHKELTFNVPIPGCQYKGDCGLPLYAMQAAQRLFLRLTLNPITALVESSPVNVLVGEGDGYDPIYDVCPAPWGNKTIQITDMTTGTVDTSFRTLPLYEMAPLVVYAHYEVLNLDEEARAELRRIPHSIPFKQQYLDILTYDQNVFIPGNTVQKRLDIRGFFEALYIRFISTARVLQNKYRDTAPIGGGEWIRSMYLTVNGIERIVNQIPEQYRAITLKTRVPRDIPDVLYFMIFGQEVDHEPAGNLYLSRSHKVQLTFQFADIPPDPVTRSRQADVGILGIGWNVLSIVDGRAVCVFAD
jgi:hypothetical protein